MDTLPQLGSPVSRRPLMLRHFRLVYAALLVAVFAWFATYPGTTEVGPVLRLLGLLLLALLLSTLGVGLLMLGTWHPAGRWILLAGAISCLAMYANSILFSSNELSATAAVTGTHESGSVSLHGLSGRSYAYDLYFHAADGLQVRTSVPARYSHPASMLLILYDARDPRHAMLADEAQIHLWRQPAESAAFWTAGGLAVLAIARRRKARG